jgi:RimJ/RimL family protein N-acetyltransferase
MIRPAKFVDIPRLVDLLCEMHAESRYAGKVEISRKAAHTLLQQCVTRHGGQHEGGALVMVAEHEGSVEGFMVGMLDRIYHVGDMLAAIDVYLYATAAAPKMTPRRLLDAYVAWASENPKVFEIRLSWTDTMEGAERIGAVYEKMGFRRCGAIYERAVR